LRNAKHGAEGIIFLSKKRAIVSAVLSIILVIFAMNFVERNVKILAEATTARIIFDYFLNIVIFFIVIYLLITFLMFIFFRTKK